MFFKKTNYIYFLLLSLTLKITTDVCLGWITPPLPPPPLPSSAIPSRKQSLVLLPFPRVLSKRKRCQDPTSSIIIRKMSTIPHNEICYINGQRCLFIPCHQRHVETIGESRKEKQQEQQQKYPPVVLLGGMGQTIASYELHTKELSKNRDVLIYECLGQGPERSKEVINQHDDGNGGGIINASLPMQVQLLHGTLQQVFCSSYDNKGDSNKPQNEQEIDIVGFSLGGRIAMAYASFLSEKGKEVAEGEANNDSFNIQIRKLHLTGVSADRSMKGKLIIESWIDLLEEGDIRGFIWSTLLGTYSPKFLYKNKNLIKEKWIPYVIKANTIEGLYALAKQTYIEDDSHPYHPMQMAKRINCINEGRLVVGQYDYDMSPLDEVTKLNVELGWWIASGEKVGVIDHAGHAVPIETPKEWINDVIKFLDK